MCNLWIPSKKGGLGRNGPAWGTRQDVSPPRCGEMTRWRILGYTLGIFSAEQLVPRTAQGRSVGDRSGVPLRSQRQHQQASSTIENKPTLTECWPSSPTPTWNAKRSPARRGAAKARRGSCQRWHLHAALQDQAACASSGLGISALDHVWSTT